MPAYHQNWTPEARRKLRAEGERRGRAEAARRAALSTEAIQQAAAAAAHLNGQPCPIGNVYDCRECARAEVKRLRAKYAAEALPGICPGCSDCAPKPPPPPSQGCGGACADGWQAIPDDLPF
jgi:hypothetical protein